MNNIIRLPRNSVKERVDKIKMSTYEKHIELLRERKSYDEMPAVSESLLAMFSDDEYPVPIIRIAEELGFKVFDMTMADEHLSGLITIDEKWRERFETDKVIGVNRNDSGAHKRFTIAHELAHYLFDAEPDEAYYNTYRTNESVWNGDDIDKESRESVANYFAANLLMPSLIFRRKYNEFLNLRGISATQEIKKDLATYFSVPMTAVQIRYKELGIY